MVLGQGGLVLLHKVAPQWRWRLGPTMSCASSRSADVKWRQAVDGIYPLMDQHTGMKINGKAANCQAGFLCRNHCRHES